MPPASDTTSGRFATEKSARISEARMPCARAAYEPNHGSRRLPAVSGSSFTHVSLARTACPAQYPFVAKFVAKW
ncbi:hypothetical protein GCM10010413_55790 [Promicromonospora sukumoe]